MPKRLLIIEDDPDILEILDIIFNEEGYEVILSEDGGKARWVKQLKPDLILLDVRLKNSSQNGIVICKKLKADPLTKRVPVILLSAENELSYITKDCGADAYMVKPFDIDVLASKVRELVT